MKTATELRDDLIAYVETIDKSALDMASLSAYASLVEKLMDLEKGDLCERIFSTPPFSDLLSDMRASFQQPPAAQEANDGHSATVMPVSFGIWN